ncbi:MAG: hypothetical protein IKE16_01430 [Solobacterium sp.]|nr:hypothetical protein [Solobacterium sp.]
MAEEVKDNTIDKLSESQKEELKRQFNDQLQKLGEVFSQCWESEEFKQAFISDPKAIFKEYEINYDENRDYKIIDTPEKTIIHVLPYEGVKPAMTQLTDIFAKHVKDLSDTDSKQILLPDWKWQIYQNNPNTVYLPIPLCPEKLTPEELEMVNGGCLLFAAFFVFVAEAVGAVTSVAVAVELAIAVTVFQAAAAVVGGLAIVLVNTVAAWTNVAATGAVAIQFNSAAAIEESKPNATGGTADGAAVNRRTR